MSANRYALKRYLILDKCLRRNKKWNWKELLDKVNEELGEETNPKTGIPLQIGKTQLFQDLKNLETDVYKAPIERDKIGRTTYYYYDDKSYSIQNAPLNEDELNQLKAAIQVLSRIRGAAQFEFLNEIIPALETKLGLKTIKKEVMSFENNLDYTGDTHIIPFFEAIVNKQVLSISYQDFKSSEPYMVTFHPYYIKQYNNRWFVFGYNELMKMENWNLALDRIQNIESINDEYVETLIDWATYFDDIIGVSKIAGNELQEIKLWFSPAQAPYIKSKPLHQTQKSINTEKGLEVRIQVVPNYELEQLILSFGESVKVIYPTAFRDKIAERIQVASDGYK